MPKHVSMAPEDLISQLEFHNLSLMDLAFLTGSDEDWCARLVKGTEPIPHWLNLLTVLWSHYPDALPVSRSVAIAMQQGGPTIEQLVEDGAEIAVVGGKPKLH